MRTLRLSVRASQNLFKAFFPPLSTNFISSSQISLLCEFGRLDIHFFFFIDLDDRTWLEPVMTPAGWTVAITTLDAHTQKKFGPWLTGSHGRAATKRC